MRFLDRILARKPTRDQFAKVVLKALAQSGITNARYDQNAFLIRVGEGDHTVFLDNAYSTYCRADRRQRQELLARFVGAYAGRVSTPSRYADARPNLLPIVRAASYRSLVELEMRAKGLGASKTASPTGKLADDLVTLLAYDTKDSIQQINFSSFKEWGVSFEDALTAATENLRDKTDPRLLRQLTPGVYHGEWADSYESARLLLPDMFYRLDLDGDPVAFVPNRNQLWVTGSRNTGGLKILLENAEQSHFAPYALSPNLYVLIDSKWGAHMPEDPLVRNLLSSLRRKRNAVDYAQQTDALEAIRKIEKTDIFFASCVLLNRKDGSQHTACVWSKGIDSLLPEAETIVFGIDPPNKVSLSVPWDAALPVVGSLMEKHPTLLPARYRVRSFPSKAQIEELRRFESR